MQRSPCLKSTELSLYRMFSLKVKSIYGPNENSCLMLNLQTQIPVAGGDLHFSLSAAGGTTVSFLLTISNLKWWVICYGPKGSRKAWPNLTKPEGHKKDFEQNVSDLLALPIPSQLLRANNLCVMAMGERHGEESEKSFWQKQWDLGGKSRWIPRCLHKHGVCSAGLGPHNWPHSWHTQQSATQGSVLVTLSDLMSTLCTLAWTSRSPQHQFPRIQASRLVLTSLRT